MNAEVSRLDDHASGEGKDAMADDAKRALSQSSVGEEASEQHGAPRLARADSVTVEDMRGMMGNSRRRGSGSADDLRTHMSRKRSEMMTRNRALSSKHKKLSRGRSGSGSFDSSTCPRTPRVSRRAPPR